MSEVLLEFARMHPAAFLRVLDRAAAPWSRMPQAARDTVMTTLERVGGVEYLARTARENPRPFVALLARLF